jgi:hypothetical protein
LTVLTYLLGAEVVIRLANGVSPFATIAASVWKSSTPDERYTLVYIWLALTFIVPFYTIRVIGDRFLRFYPRPYKTFDWIMWGLGHLAVFVVIVTRLNPGPPLSVAVCRLFYSEEVCPLVDHTAIRRKIVESSQLPSFF